MTKIQLPKLPENFYRSYQWSSSLEKSFHFLPAMIGESHGSDKDQVIYWKYLKEYRDRLEEIQAEAKQIEILLEYHSKLDF